MKITQILVESERSLEQVSLDMKEIFHAAVPDSMKNENVSSAENDYDYFFDSVISAQGVDFKIHKVSVNGREKDFFKIIKVICLDLESA